MGCGIGAEKQLRKLCDGMSAMGRRDRAKNVCQRRIMVIV